MGVILEALRRLNELDSTSNKQREFKYKLHFPGYELTDEDELDDKGNPINVNDDPNEAPIYKKKRAAAGYIYVITMNDPEDDSPKKFLCKIGYAKDVNVRLGQFNKDAGNPSSLNWFARIPIYLGLWNEKDQEFKPIKGKTDQLDKRIHDVIDTVVDSADSYMKRRYQSTQGIDIRKLDVNGHRKEWYLMSPQQAVDIIEAIIDTQPAGTYGETEYNMKHPLYTATHQTKTVDAKGNVVTSTKANKGEKIDFIRSTQAWNGYKVRLADTGPGKDLRQFEIRKGGLSIYYLRTKDLWGIEARNGRSSANEIEFVKNLPGYSHETKLYHVARATVTELFQIFPDIPKPWVDFFMNNKNVWNIANGESDQHMQELNDMIPEDQLEKEDD